MQGPLVSHNPTTGAPLGTVSSTPLEAITLAVAAAQLALPAWRALGLAGRRDVLLQALPALEAAIEPLAAQLTAEMGKPFREARGEVRSCVVGLEAELDEIVNALADQVLEDAHAHTTIFRDPHGVCAAITPWNFPIAMPHSLVIPALMAGNTVVFKPSELTPLVADAWARIWQSVLPQNVLQVIHGDEAQGKALVAAAVDMIAFTGSRAAGTQILAAAAPTLKRVVLELGGKDPLVVLRDADLAAAAKFAARSSFRNAGQVCVATERIYVDREIAEAFVAKLVEEADAMKVGDGAVDGTDVGPMVTLQQKAHVVGQVRDALARGAVLVAGSVEDLAGPDQFLRPLVLTGVDHAMPIMVDETFGPVVGVMAFTDEAEAVRLANDTPYGLGATVFGAEDHATAIARQLDAGMVGVNRSVGGARGTPWVGAKQSGYGFHSGVEGHRQFAQVRTVSRRKGG